VDAACPLKEPQVVERLRRERLPQRVCRPDSGRPSSRGAGDSVVAADSRKDSRDFRS